MQGYSVSSFSGRSQADALNKVLYESVKLDTPSAHVHVFIQGVSKEKDGWRAIVSVIVEPKESASPQKPEAGIAGPSGSASPNEGPANAFENRREQEDFAEKKHAQEERFERTLKQENESQAKEARIAAQEEEQAVLYHLYLDVVNEMLWKELANPPRFDYVHILAGDSLWSAAQKIHPDIDLYEAVHGSSGSHTPVLAAGESGPKPHMDLERSPEVRIHELKIFGS